MPCGICYKTTWVGDLILSVSNEGAQKIKSVLQGVSVGLYKCVGACTPSPLPLAFFYYAVLTTGYSCAYVSVGSAS